MTASGVYSGPGFGVVQSRPIRPIGHVPAAQVDETAQASEPAPATTTQASTAPGPAQARFSAMLGGMAAGGYAPGSPPAASAPAQPPALAQPAAPAIASGQPAAAAQAAVSGQPAASTEPDAQDTVGSSLASLFQSIFSADLSGAGAAATRLQAALAAPFASPDSFAPPPAGSPAQASASASPTGAPPATAPAAGTAIRAGLGNLAGVVQASDAETSKAAVAAFLYGLQAMETQRGAGTAEQELRATSPSMRGNLATLLQSVESSDMPAAKTAALAIQQELGAPGNQGGDGVVPSAGISASRSSAPVSAASPPAPAVAPPLHETPGFLAALGNLMNAVQSGDTEGSKAAATSVLDQMKSQANAFRAELAGLIAPSDAAPGA